MTKNLIDQNEKILNILNQRSIGFIKMMGGRAIEVDIEKKLCVFEFDIGKEFCHSIDVVQGGFVTAMLDATMSHAVFALQQDINQLSSLEIKTSFIEATRAGKLRVEGYVVKLAHRIAFLEGKIYNDQGVLTATATSVANLKRKKEE